MLQKVVDSCSVMQIRKIFDDAYRSQMSCILVDNVERLLDYGPIGPRYSNLTLQSLLVLLKKHPPKGNRLLVICTTSRKDVLDQLEMVSAFSEVLHVSNLNQAQHLQKVLVETNAFTPQEVQSVVTKMHNYRINIGVKKLLGLLDMVKPLDPKHRFVKFTSKLEDEGLATPY